MAASNKNNAPSERREGADIHTRTRKTLQRAIFLLSSLGVAHFSVSFLLALFLCLEVDLSLGAVFGAAAFFLPYLILLFSFVTALVLLQANRITPSICVLVAALCASILLFVYDIHHGRYQLVSHEQHRVCSSHHYVIWWWWRGR